MQHGVVSVRPASELPISGNVYSYLREDGSPEALAHIPTPTASDASMGGMNPRSCAVESGMTRGVNLSNYVTYWPTPRAKGLMGGTGSRDMMQKKALAGDVSKEEAEGMLGTMLWPTPTAADSRRQSPLYKRGNTTLIGAVKEREMVPTPTKSMLYEQDLERARYEGRKLPTPTASDAQGGLGGHRGGGPNLKTAIGGRLNPPWDEWLMGLPIGWTGSALVGTPLFRLWQRSHSKALEELLNER